MGKGKNEEVQPFGWRDEVGYLAGNLAGDLTFTLCSGYLMKFYTDVIGVNAAIIGVMMMLAQILDAFTDCGMGRLADRPFPFGKKNDSKEQFLPWIRLAAGPAALTSFLMYAGWIRNTVMPIRIIWMFASYFLYSSVFYTMAIIPYGALAATMTGNTVERTKLSNLRHVGGTLAMTFINVIISVTVYYQNADGEMIFSGTRMMGAAGCCSITAFALYMLCTRLVTERCQAENDYPKNNRTDSNRTKRNFEDCNRTDSNGTERNFEDCNHADSNGTGKNPVKKLPGISSFFRILSCRSLWAVLFLIIFQEIANSTYHGMGSYIYPDYFHDTAAMSIASVEETVICLLIAAVIVKIVLRTGKKEITAVGTIICMVSLFLGLVLHTHHVVLWLLLDGGITAGLSLINPVAYALVADVSDDCEVHSGIRAEGTIYGCYSFCRKFGQSCASAVRGFMLSSAGYTIASANDSSVTDKIYSFTCLVPLLGFGAMLFIILFLYPLGKKRVAENQKILHT